MLFDSLAIVLANVNIYTKNLSFSFTWWQHMTRLNSLRNIQ